MRRKPRVGLALGSGSARGWAHIGAIRALEERGIKADLVCGTSIGALVGAAYASGELDRLEKWVTGLAWTTVVRLMDLTWRGGLIRGQRLFTLFRTIFQDRDIDGLPIPYGAVATELYSGRELWLRHGNLLDAVMVGGHVSIASLSDRTNPSNAVGPSSATSSAREPTTIPSASAVAARA